MRASWTGEAGIDASATQRARAVDGGGRADAEREAGALLDSLDEVLRLLDEVPLEGLLEPRCAGE
jgi:hypothetical protein